MKGSVLISRFKFSDLNEVKSCYGKDNIVPIDFISQIIAYAKMGCQPVYICESEKPNKKGKIVCWYLKSETQYAYSKWMETKPSK